MKQKILILTFLLVGLTNGLIAQTDTLKNNVFGGFIIFPIEFPIIDNQPASVYQLDELIKDNKLTVRKYLENFDKELKVTEFKRYNLNI